jgi:hypothetical protein
VTARRFPPPWSVEDIGAAFVVRDQNGQGLTYIYFEDEPQRHVSAKMLSKDEARRIAINFAKLPTLLHSAKERGEENRHQDDNDGEHQDGSFRQRHERVIRLLVTRVIVAACCGVFDLIVVAHRIPPGAIALRI